MTPIRPQVGSNQALSRRHSRRITARWPRAAATIAALSTIACTSNATDAPAVVAADAATTADAGLTTDTSVTDASSDRCPDAVACGPDLPIAAPNPETAPECHKPEDCDTGRCTDSATSSTGKRCSVKCASASGCGDPTAFECVTDSGTSDPSSFCVSKTAHLCDPCQSSAACHTAGSGTGNQCVSYGSTGYFCGIPCAADGDCPPAYTCKNAEVIGVSTVVKQCVATAGTCTCSVAQISWAKKGGSAGGSLTECFQTVDGKPTSCKGTRTCTSAGSLSACTGQVPATEVCDSLDNDCNGKVDDVDCSDGSVCTKDACDAAAKACAHLPAAEGLTCEADGLKCTVGGLCANGTCTGETPLNCDDKNACTADSCTELSGGQCTHSPVPLGSCDDGDACTVQDKCSLDSACSGIPVACTGDGCTANLKCDKVTGCVGDKAANGTPCDDGLKCTSGDECQGGTCTAALPLNCDDLNPCTQDACSPAVGCVSVAVAATCTDGNACTTGDGCLGGSCVGAAASCGDANPCTTDSCEPQSGCLHKANAALCDDGNPCTMQDNCILGACAPGIATNCEDGNPCTDNACDQKTGNCINLANAASCTDGDACTLGDGCSGKNCVPGVAKNCSDGNACTDDQCAGGACVHAATAAGCDDGDACTPNDVCAAGNCVAGPALDCKDGDPCTTDSCNLGQCVHALLEGPATFDQTLFDDTCFTFAP